MSEIIAVSSDWLALREAEDSRARSRELAYAASRRLGSGPFVVHDLGSGTGSMMRWLAPLLPGPQAWVLHDWNPDLTEHATNGVVPLDRDGRPVSVRTRTGELERLDAGALAGASLVTASALLDVLTTRELRAVIRACLAVGCPVLLSLSVTGEVRLDPPDPPDEVFAASFNEHQQRLVGGRRLLGPAGVGRAERLFREAGWSIRTADTRWRLGDHDPVLLEQWFDGWVDAALEHRADLRDEGAAYRALRSEQFRRGELSAVVVHTDLLAWP
ncbi:SAM-dependent methyltransferase [Agromyces mariniharenae]|uniref:SAM-dependent methyltransferase n=1 Tax=Agromyces mariniharenae TaxID=2604423 RepID=A0A5S4UW90_9MICO|nr:SAM-dependent methyltransferase [Agromyces mariniharenae]TYL51147.1 SAM-dependent methyltransferase [Agromyces mariniharenae]